MKYLKTYEGLVEDFRELSDKKDDDYLTLIRRFEQDTEKIASKYINDLKENVIVPLTDNYRCEVKHRLNDVNPSRDGQLWLYVRVFMGNDKDLKFLEQNLKEFELNLKASTLNDMTPFYALRNGNSANTIEQLIKLENERHSETEMYFDIHLKK